MYQGRLYNHCSGSSFYRELSYAGKIAGLILAGENISLKVKRMVEKRYTY
jgi:hypothetical protein